MKKSRKEKYIKRRRRKILLRRLLFILILFSILVFTLLKVGIFNVNSIKVIGNQKVSAEDIIKRSGFKIGESYFKISKKNRIDDINSIAMIKSSKISFIPKSVTIKVVERIPKIQIEDYGNYYIVDDELRIIKVESNMTEGLLDMIISAKTNHKVGTFLFEKNEKVREFFYKLFKDELFGELKQVSPSDKSINFITKDNIEIDFGSYENVDYKFKMLKEILKDIKETNKNATKIFMEKGENPIVRLESN